MTQNLYIFLAFALAVIGGVLGSSLGRSHRRLCALISLGAGTLFGVTVSGILPESFESLQWWGLLLALSSGYVVFVLITKYVYHVCPACAASHFDEATRHRFGEIATAIVGHLVAGAIAKNGADAAGFARGVGRQNNRRRPSAGRFSTVVCAASYRPRTCSGTRKARSVRRGF